MKMIRGLKVLVFWGVLGVGGFVSAQTQPAGQISRHVLKSKSRAAGPDLKTVTDTIAGLQGVLAAPQAVAGGSAAATSEPLTLSVAVSRAQAAVADADAVAKNAQSYVAVAKTKASADATSLSASASDEFKAIQKAAPFADAAVSAAAVADGFAKRAATDTDVAGANADADNAVLAAVQAHTAMTGYLGSEYNNRPMGCQVSGLDSQGNPGYTYKQWLPLVGPGCKDAAVLWYYNVSKATTIANQAQYLYNAAQSTNQVNADLLTTVFSGGVQVVLAGTATAGSSQPAVAGAVASAASSSTTDSVGTAISKLEQGGDFNLRLAYPLANYVGSNGGYSVTVVPNLGFAVNGLSGQSTVTESTEYSGNIPVEFYGQYGSIPSGGVAAVVYADVKLGGDFVSSDFANKVGTNSKFFLGQFSAGIEFLKSVRVGFQYFLGPKQAYCVPNTAGCTAVTGTMSGVHLVVSFTPPASKS